MTSQATSMNDRLKADRQWRQLHMQLRRIEQALKPQCLPERFETPGHSIALAGRLADQLERSSGPALTTHERESDHTLTERDRALVALVIRRFVARDIEARGIAKTYDPLVTSVSAFELLELSDELLHCCDGDSVAMATAAADDIDDARTDLGSEHHDDTRAQDIVAELESIKVLAKFKTVTRLDLECKRGRE